MLSHVDCTVKPNHPHCDGGGGGGGNGGDDSAEVSYILQDLGTLGGNESEITVDGGLNVAGAVAGQSLPAGATGQLWEEGHAFLIDPEDSDGDGNPDRWVRDDDGDGINDLVTVLSPLGGTDSQVWAGNADGQIAGNARDEDGEFHATLWELEASGNPTITDLGTVKGTDQTFGRDVNNVSQVVGYSTNTKGKSTEREPFIWQDGTITKLSKLITDMGSLDDIDEVLAINDSGHIIGEEGIDDSGAKQNRVWIAIPDMSTSALHVAGEAVAQSTGSEPLSHDVLQPILQQAADHWSAAGLQDDPMRDLDVRIANLSSTVLGMANESARTIWIDQDAAGYGWSANTSSDNAGRSQRFCDPTSENRPYERHRKNRRFRISSPGTNRSFRFRRPVVRLNSMYP